jgi:ribonuclease HII
MEKTVLGIDEAGRGPVIGPLVIAGVKIKESKEINLKNIGVKDSKLLTPMQRENLFDSVLKIADKYKVIIISPSEIDSALYSDSTNLNWLEADKAVEIINALKPKSAYIDCPSTNTKKYEEYLHKKLNVKADLIVEHKADFNYPVVSAASIIAKVTRDREIEEIKKKIGVNFGSGYPSDPLTQDFLKENYNRYSEIFRHSWSSFKRAAEKKNQTVLKSHFPPE